MPPTRESSDRKSVTIASVDIEGGGKGGWIALHQDAGGKPGQVKYYVAVPAGKIQHHHHRDPGGITTGAYWPMLHVDDHTIGTYEFSRFPAPTCPPRPTRRSS